MDALGALFTANADFVQVAGQRWKGRRTIQTNVALLHGKLPRDTAPTFPAASYGIFAACTYQFHTVDVRFIRPDVAVAHVTWTQFGDPRFERPRHGVLTFVVVRDEGRWLLDAAQNTVRG